MQYQVISKCTEDDTIVSHVVEAGNLKSALMLFCDKLEALGEKWYPLYMASEREKFGHSPFSYEFFIKSYLYGDEDPETMEPSGNFCGYPAWNFFVNNDNCWHTMVINLDGETDD